MSQVAKNFRQGSFKGANFIIEGAETSTGRRNIKHEFPGRDTPFTEDNGLKTRAFTIEVFVLGSSYEADRDALVSACESKGSGPLVHPFYGTKQVVCDECRYRESKDELGKVNFTLTFIEAGSNVFPSAVSNPLAGVAGASAGALGASATAFQNSFSVIGSSASGVAAAQSKVNSFADTVTSNMSGINADTQALANLTFNIRNLKGSAATLLSQPGLLASKIQDVIGSLTSLVPGLDRGPVRSALTGVMTYGSGFPVISPTTANLAMQAKNQNAMVALVRQSAVSNLAIESASDTYGSFDDALAQQKVVTTELDAWMTNPNTSDDLYAWLQSLRVQTVKAVPGPNQDLPRITTFTPGITLPSLILIYELYKDPSFESDLLARNKITNPAFIPSGAELKVLLGQTT